MTKIPDYNGECLHCGGTGKEPETPTFLCRVLPPDASQVFHELLQEKYPDHDEVSCHCCCLACPGWTSGEEFISDEEIREMIHVHDYDSGKPFPFQPFPGHLL